MLLTRTADTIAQVVCKAVEDKKATIVNKGKLNPTYAYFSTAPGSTGGHTLITGSAITLSETSSTKYYTVATDLIIFNDDGKYVLLYERCPHKNCGHPARKVLNNEFTYGGSLSLPGGFFNPKEDIDINGHPDFDVMSKRLLIKELYPYSNWSFLNQPEFVGVEFNNFRDIRWRTSQDYVPTVTLVFKVKLRRRLFKEKGLPTIWRMKGDICERGRWVDIEIVKSVHRKYGNVYETFNNSYNEYDLDRFITKYLFLDQRTKLPKNKEKSENAVLRNVAGNQNTIEHNEKSDYEFSDFAFDHIHLIMKELGGYLLTPPNSPIRPPSNQINFPPLRKQIRVEESNGENKLENLSDKAQKVFLVMATTKYGRNERQEKKKIKDLEDKADDIDEYLDEFLKLMPSDGNSIQPSDPLAYLETGLNYLVVMHPLVTLGFFALRAVYKLAMAKKLENKAKAELFGKFASAVNKLNCLNEMDAAVLQKLPKNQQSVRRNMENALDFMLDVAEFLLSSDASAWETVTGARTKKYKNAQEHIEECMRAIDNSTSTLMIVIATHLLKKNTALKRSSVQVDAYPLSKAGISRSIRKIIAKKGNAIKNKGTLNPAYSYFQDGKLVINSKQTLSSDGDASTKFYTVTGDCIIFDSTANYVLLEIRCPHEKDEVSMRSKFHYGGLLGTPGSFYRHKQDNTHINPDFQKFSNRILNEALKLFANPLPTAAQYDYVFPQFDNFRDIRWYLSESYVPSLALQFAARLSETEYENGLDLPELNRPNGSCDKAYWVDFRIIRKVYDDNKELFEMFAGEYDEIKFQQFVRSDKYFSLGADGTPVNKSPAENSIIRGFADSQVIQFNEEEEYLLRDFAFDHIQNIVSAFDVLLL